jgi:hypothetical protein
LQIHDFNGGVAPSGLFWTLRLPDDSVVVSPDGRQLSVVVQDLAMEDDVLRPVAVTVPATASFRIDWRGKKARRRRGRGLAVDATDPAAFLGRFRKAKATATFSGAIDGFSFQTDVASPAVSRYALVGTERNGVFLPAGDGRCGACGSPGAVRRPARDAAPR